MSCVDWVPTAWPKHPQRNILRRMRWSSWTHRRDALSSAALSAVLFSGGTACIAEKVIIMDHKKWRVSWDSGNMMISSGITIYIYIYIHACIALHCITYIHSDVSFTMWNPRYFLETPYAFIRHPTKSYCLILLLETLQIPSQVYPKDIPMIPQLYPNISRYRNISQDFQFGIPIWRYLSAPPGIHTYYEGYPGYHRGGWRLRSGPEAGKRQKWKMPSKMITLVTSKKRGFTWFLLFSKGFMAISWFSWGCRWDIIGIQSTIYYRL